MTTDAENSAAAQEPSETGEQPKRPTRTRRSASGEPAAEPRPRRRTAAAASKEAPPAAEAAVAEAEPKATAAGATRRRSAPKRAKPVVEQRPLPRLMGRYRDEIRAQLIDEFGYASTMQAPEGMSR